MKFQSNLFFKIITISSLFLLLFVIASCFFDVDIENDVHDNTVEIDVCQDIQERFPDGGVEQEMSCDEDSGTCDLKESGSGCESDEECDSNLCLCNICISFTDFL